MQNLYFKINSSDLTVFQFSIAEYMDFSYMSQAKTLEKNTHKIHGPKNK